MEERGNKLRKNKLFMFLFLSLFLLLFFHSCESPFSEKFGEIIVRGDIIEGTGTITYIGVEGGFYGIVTNKYHYDPINLSSEFKVGGLQVKFKAKIRKDLYSYHMWGIIIELIYVKKL